MTFSTVNLSFSRQRCLSEAPFASELCFVMIGNLQKNKINQVVGKVRYIHSISPHPYRLLLFAPVAYYF